MSNIAPPRALHAEERALLDHLLARDAPGFDQLREQALYAMVTSSSLYLISLHVPRDAALAADVTKPVASRAVSVTEQDWADATLWITKDGYLDGIEIMWPDRPPVRLPRPDELFPAVGV